MSMFERGQVVTLLGWLDGLPDEKVRPRPMLSLAYAWLYLMFGRLEGVEPRLQDTELALRGQEGEVQSRFFKGHVAAIRGELACSQGDVSRAIAFSRQALELLPEEVDPFVRGMAAVNIALNFDETYSSRIDIAKARDMLTQAAWASGAAGHTQASIVATRLLARLEMAQGRLHQAAETYQHCLDQLTSRQAGPVHFAGTIYIGLGELQYEWNDLDAAKKYVREGIALGKQTRDLRALIPGYVAWARLHQAQRQVAAANEAIRQAARLAQEGNIAWLTTQVTAVQVRLWLAQGNHDRAERWAQTCGLKVGDAISQQREKEYMALARVHIALGAYDVALALLDWLLAVIEKAGLTGHIIEILTLQALAHQGYGQKRRALTALERAVSLAKTEGYVRLFIDEGEPLARLLSVIEIHPDPADEMRVYIRPLLTILKQEAAERVATLSAQSIVEPLTSRELEVLWLIAAGLKNREIADELVITVGTVKGHIHKIYRKLDVDNRVQAASRARELKLL